jgi:hypothetical protein
VSTGPTNKLLKIIIMKFISAASLIFLALPSSTSADGPTPCLGSCAGDGAEKVCTFTFSVNLFASELGYYTVDECGDTVMPVLGMEKGVTYKFLQHNVTNYKHPLGFAYYADGAHDDVDELEPGIAPPGSSSACADDFSCPAPMYMLAGEMMGVYNNNPKSGNMTSGEEDFGLDHYEPDFFLPITDWAANGDYDVELYFDSDDFDGDIFYFCHVSEVKSSSLFSRTRTYLTRTPLC